MTNVKDGWAMLAAAIIDSGLRANDKSFLECLACFFAWRQSRLFRT